MNIWLINHYAVPIKYYPLARTTNFAKYLIRQGHNVTIFAASAVHNSDVNLISDKSVFAEITDDSIKYVLINTSQYKGNGISRIINMFQFAYRLPKVCNKFKKPDIIMASSATPLACMAGIKLSKKYKCKCIAEVSDLWPESFVEYGLISRNNLLLKLMYMYEKQMYKKADKIIFTMEGGKDYIVEKKWDIEHGGPIDLKKIHYINNGVDLEAFSMNLDHYWLDDDDLDNKGSFKVVYVGSIRKANNLNKIIETAWLIKNRNVRFLLWGAGDEVEPLKNKIKEQKISNVVFKGQVDKKFIPSILSRSDLNFFILNGSELFRFGLSLNKSFDYIASGKPLLIIGKASYSLVDKYHCGVHIDSLDPKKIADDIDRFVNLPRIEYETHCKNALIAAQEFDFKKLTNKLLSIMYELTEN
jgi:glycosyltransferase involved in cell wall biosynthesis